MVGIVSLSFYQKRFGKIKADSIWYFLLCDYHLQSVLIFCLTLFILHLNPEFILLWLKSK
jgi:hypothetical protein